MSITSEIRLRVRKEGDVVLNQLSAKLNDLAQRSVLSNNKFKDLANTLKASDAQIRTKSIQGLQDYARAWRELANNVDITSKEFRQATQEAQRFEREVAKAQGRRAGGGRFAAAAKTTGAIAAAGVFGGPEGLLGAGIGAFMGGPAGAAVGGAIGAQAGMFRQQLGGAATYAAEISKQRQALQLVTKDAGEYQRALSFIDKTSRELAIPQELITRQFTQLTASVKGAGGNVRDAEKAFIGVASGIRGTGGSLEQLDSALLATSQVFSKGKVSAEELRQQIGERLPGAFSLFAKSMGMTPQELDKALEKGQVSLQNFQDFAALLFDKYGDNAKIIADGPDAAGDRLKTALSKLSESVGTLLKPIGAGFQDIFTKIINIIDKAVRKFNEFAKIVGQKDLVRLRTDLVAQNQLLSDLEKAGAKGAQKGSILQEQYARALEKRRRIQGEITRYELQAKPAGAAPEPPSKLPGILPDSKAGESEAKKLAQIAQQNFNRTLQQLGITLNVAERKQLAKELAAIESDKQVAIQEGNKNEVERLDLAARRLTLETTSVALLTEREKLEKLINENKAKGIDTTAAANKLLVAEAAFAENELNLKKQTNAELARQQSLLDEQAKARAAIQKLLIDAQAQSIFLTEEDRKRMEINRTLSDVIDNFYGKLTNDELLEAIRRLRKELEGVADAGKDFGSKLGKSFADVVKASGELAQNLGASLGNAFLGLGDQLAEFVTTGKMQFGEFARSVLSDLSRIFIQFAMFQTLKALVPGGSALGRFLNLPGRAGGGPVSRFYPYMVGERGPELFVPNASGQIVNKEQFQRMMGSFGGGPFSPFLTAMVLGGQGYSFGPAHRSGIPGFGLFGGGPMAPFLKGMAGSVQARAMGGSVAAGNRYLVGENGPEMYVPNVGAMRSGGSPTNVVVNVDASGSSAQGNQGNSNRLGEALGAAVRAELIRQKRPGGLLA